MTARQAEAMRRHNVEDIFVLAGSSARHLLLRRAIRARGNNYVMSVCLVGWER
jgi:hypothetical protein